MNIVSVETTILHENMHLGFFLEPVWCLATPLITKKHSHRELRDDDLRHASATG